LKEIIINFYEKVELFFLIRGENWKLWEHNYQTNVFMFI